MLKVEKLRKEYTRGRSSFAAVDDVDLCIERGEFVSVIGRSGSGKTTLLNMIAGLLRPTSGTVAFEGVGLSTLNDAGMSRLRSERMGYVPQGAGLLSNLTVLDNVRLPFYFSGREGDPSGRAYFLLDEMGIAHLADMYPRHLSGGELRRASIARALINSPVLLIADEPTGDLDAETTKDVMRLLSRIGSQGTALLVVTHESDPAAWGDRVLTMESGRLLPMS